MIMEYWNKLQQNRDGRVVAIAVTYLLNQSRGKSYQRVKSYFYIIFNWVEGFLEKSNTEEEIVRHPATAHIVPLLFNTFRLARVLHDLYDPAARSALSPGFVKAHDMLDSEIQMMLGTGTGASSEDSTTDTNPLQRVQQFLSRMHNTVFNFLGLLGNLFISSTFILIHFPSWRKQIKHLLVGFDRWSAGRCFLRHYRSGDCRCRNGLSRPPARPW